MRVIKSLATAAKITANERRYNPAAGAPVTQGVHGTSLQLFVEFKSFGETLPYNCYILFQALVATRKCSVLYSVLSKVRVASPQL